MYRILIADDDKGLRKAITDALKGTYTVFEASNIKEAKRIMEKENIDLYLIDMNLPDGTGYDFCKWLRPRTNAIIIFITVENDEEVLVKCLEEGGDDYITKPFSLMELKSRVHANLRRFGAETKKKDILSIGKYRLDCNSHQLFINDKSVALTGNEYQILESLMKAGGRLLTRNNLLSYWDAQGNFVEENTLSVTVSRLRKKVIDKKGYCPIQTIRGIGYRFVIEEDYEKEMD